MMPVEQNKAREGRQHDTQLHASIAELSSLIVYAQQTTGTDDVRIT